MNLDVVCQWMGYALLAGYAALTVAELIRYFRTALCDAPAPLATPASPAPSISAASTTIQAALVEVRTPAKMASREEGMAIFRRRWAGVALMARSIVRRVTSCMRHASRFRRCGRV